MSASYKGLPKEREVVYVVCPLCGRNRVLEVRSDKAKAKGKGRLRWDFFDPETSPLIQIREAGGKLPHSEQPSDLGKDRKTKGKPGKAKALGFPLKKSLTFSEAKQINDYNDQIYQIQKQIQKILILCQ